MFCKYHIKPALLIVVIALACSTGISAQDSILAKPHTFSNGSIKKGNALNIISRRTGYYFTYDSRLLDTEARITLDAVNEPLEEILRTIVENDSLRFSVLGSHIIIARIAPEIEPTVSDSVAHDQFRIAGRVVDHETGDPLPFATVAISNKPRGSISNIDGYFTLNVSGDLINDTLAVSYLGYLNRHIPVSETPGNDFTIMMFRDYIPIPEIIIRSQLPQEIIRKWAQAIPENYGTTPASMWGFYREGTMKGKELQLYSEAVMQLYKAPYGTNVRDQVKVVRSRKSENSQPGDTLLLRLKAGLSTSLLLDGVKNQFEFLDEEYFGLYNYSMTDIVTIDDAAAYVIEFTQKENIRDPLFRGTVIISTTDYGLLQADFEIHPSYISRSDELFVTSPVRRYSIRPSSVRYRVSYKKSGDRYFLSHVRGDLRFIAKKKRSLFSSGYDVFFELAITESDTQNVTRFERNEIIPLESVFSRTISGYDFKFWGNFDFLNPEEDIIKSLDNITQKFSRYIEEGK